VSDGVGSDGEESNDGSGGRDEALRSEDGGEVSVLTVGLGSGDVSVSRELGSLVDDDSDGLLLLDGGGGRVGEGGLLSGEGVDSSGCSRSEVGDGGFVEGLVGVGGRGGKSRG